MREQQFPDGSVDLGQGAISPSRADIDFSKRSDRPPLRHFPGRQALTPVVIVGTSVLASGCVSIGDAPPNPDRSQSGTENPGISLEERDELFDTFFAEYNGRQTEMDPALAWLDVNGIPRDAFSYDNLSDIVSDLKGIIAPYFDIVPNEEGVSAEKGDLVLVAGLGYLLAIGEQETIAGQLDEKVLVHFKEEPNAVVPVTMGSILARLRPKRVFNADNTDSVTAGVEQGGQGEVLGESTQIIDVLLPFPEGETWALTGSSHEGGSLDWAPWKPMACASDGTYPVPKDKIDGDADSWVTASISGVITELRGKGAKDPGVLVIEGGDGVEVVYRHVLLTQDEIKNKALEIDQKVKAGDPLIHPACVGKTSGLHVDTSVRVGGKKLPAEDVAYSGWVTKPGKTPYNGTLEKDGEEARTASVYRCAPPDNATKPCEGIRNDITNTGDNTSIEPRATERFDSKQRIDAILAVEQDDSYETMSRKMVLLKWLDALTTKQLGDDASLDTSILNLEEWEANFQRLLNGETISDNPLKIEFLRTGGYFDDLRIGRGEIDNISIQVNDRSGILSDLDRKNGQEGYLEAIITNYERSQSLVDSTGITMEQARTQFDNLPPMSEWRDNQIEIGIWLKDGIWTIGEFMYYIGGGKDYGISNMKDYQGWQGIEVVSKMFIDSAYGGPNCLTQREYEGGQGYEGCIFRGIEIG